MNRYIRTEIHIESVKDLLCVICKAVGGDSGNSEQCIQLPETGDSG